MAPIGGCFQCIDSFRQVEPALPLDEIYSAGAPSLPIEVDKWIAQMVRQKSLSRSSGETQKFLANCLTRGNVNFQDASGTTALHLLARDGDGLIVQHILKARADPELKNSDGQSALDIAMECDNQKVIKHMEAVATQNKSKRKFEALQFLRKVPLFERLPRSEHKGLAAAFAHKVFDAGATVILQGDAGHEFFVIESGVAIVEVNGMQVSSLGKNDYFGEMALLKNEPRNATVKASPDGPLTTRVLTRETFEEMDLRKKLTFKKRKAVFAVSAETVEDIEIPTKSLETLEFLLAAFKANKNFCDMVAGSSNDELLNIARQAVHFTFPANTAVIEEGNVKADLMYVLESGSCDFKSEQLNLQFSMYPGASFGELALMYRAPRKATITTSEESSIWALSRAQLKQVLEQTLRSRIAEFRKVLGKVEILNSLDEREMDAVANAVVQKSFYPGDYILKQGTEGDALYILYSGTVAQEVDGRVIGQLGANAEREQYQFFGEKALLEDTVYTQSIRVMSSEAVALVLHQETFQKINAIKESQSQKNQAYQYEYSRENLINLGELGKGAFGLVTLQKDREYGCKFALKALSKGFIVLQHQEACVAMEKQIMRELVRNKDSPFVVRLAATFDGPEHVEFLMEAAMGGELYTVYQRNNFYGNEAMARFFTACAGAGIAHLHESHMVYRDLKPENILLDARGYGKVADFGLAKWPVMGPLYTFCGTPEYFAPEITDPKGYTVSVDWWGLGILAFELMMGNPPFEDDDPMQLIAKAKDGLTDKMFKGQSGPWTEFVRDMLTKDPMQRLPMRSGGFQNFADHSWYRSQSPTIWDWNAFYMQTQEPPWAPPLQDENNLENFDPGADDPPQIPYDNPGTGWEDDFDDPIGPPPTVFLSPAERASRGLQ